MRVFIAEDEPLVRLGFQKMVANIGHEVVGTAGNGKLAIERILELRPDIVMMDVNLPEIDGITAIETVQKVFQIPAVVITGYRDSKVTERVSAAGVFGYLQKPVDEYEIESALSIAYARYAEQRAAISERDQAINRLSERKVIERAKGLLMDQFGIGDEDAMRFLQRKSRNENRKLVLVAQDILRREELIK
ncbi:response regulator [Butyricicoccus faecihominis]|uniref:ANTAR domain-containing response regulator n=1 Tax=Butyricicoccaceae TaxID=3085642 RepID=UPI00247ACEC5|nr:response regulator [Agathobaculum sp. NTUH-O15-33]MCQ5129589.1 response regulator [Butyricicoccus faecihominis]WNX86079.1 response regulator [Agathobaculum sp. NTUH-O15-33]